MNGEPGGDPRRRHERHAVYRDVCVSTGNSWQDCTIVDISEDGALLRAGAVPEVGTSLVLCGDDIGVLAGTVIRHSADGFAVMFEISEAARLNLIEWLTAYLSAPSLAS